MFDFKWQNIDSFLDYSIKKPTIEVSAKIINADPHSGRPPSSDPNPHSALRPLVRAVIRFQLQGLEEFHIHTFTNVKVAATAKLKRQLQMRWMSEIAVGEIKRSRQRFLRLLPFLPIVVRLQVHCRGIVMFHFLPEDFWIAALSSPDIIFVAKWHKWLS